MMNIVHEKRCAFSQGENLHRKLALQKCLCNSACWTSSAEKAHKKAVAVCA